MATWTQAELDALERAIASGVVTVKFEDREVTYRSMTDLLKAREVIARSLGQGDPHNGRRRVIFDKEL